MKIIAIPIPSLVVSLISNPNISAPFFPVVIQGNRPGEPAFGLRLPIPWKIKC